MGNPFLADSSACYCSVASGKYGAAQSASSAIRPDSAPQFTQAIGLPIQPHALKAMPAV